MRTLYTAALLHDGERVRENAALLVEHGRVAEVGSAGELVRRFPDAEVVQGELIAPPPVNAHTHLDMSAYSFRALPYFRWIPEVVIAGRQLRGAEAARRGADEMVSLGQAVGDIAFSEEVARALLSHPTLEGIVHLEVLGPRPSEASARFKRFRQAIDRLRPLERERLRLGISPHATYTVSASLFKKLSAYAAHENLPMQIHAAEHASESRLFAHGGGPLWAHRLRPLYPNAFAEVIGRKPSAHNTPVRHLARLGALGPRTCVVHGVHLSPEDVQILADSGASVVSCPRSNHHLQCGEANLPALLQAGVPLAFGSDSVASGGSQDVRDDVLWAMRRHPAHAGQLLHAAVCGGRRALGRKPETIARGEAFLASWLWNATP